MSDEQEAGQGVVLPVGLLKPVLPEELPILLLSGQVVFPMSVAPIRTSDKSEMKLLDEVAMGNRLVGLLAKRDGEGAPDSIKEAFEVGCVARILQLQHVPDGSINVLFQAFQRFRVAGVIRREPYLFAKIELLPIPESNAEELAPLATTVKNQMMRLIELSPNIPDGASAMVENIEDPGFLADLVATNLNIPVSDKQKLLETLPVKERLERLTYLLAHQVDILELSDKIQKDVKNSIDSSQREYFLRQQLKAIRAELGEAENEKPEIKEYRERIEALELKGDVRKEALRELERLSQMNEASAEYHVITTYLDWIVELPWNRSTEDRLDIDAAERILDEDHFGLNKVKKRIVEYLAVRKLKPDAPGPILCFVGPPGVGKTSLGKSIARTMGARVHPHVAGRHARRGRDPGPP